MVLLKTLLLFILQLSVAYGATNLDFSCSDNIEALLNIPIGKNFKINLRPNEVMFEGKLFMQRDTNGEDYIIWSLFEVDMAHVYRSSIFSLHELENGDKLLILDVNGNLLYKGYYYGYDEKKIINFDGMTVEYSPSRKPMLYKDRAFTNQILNNTEFVELFQQRTHAYVIKDRNQIDEFIYEELLIGQKVYEKHMSNPNRLVKIGDGPTIELKPNHELVSLKIDRDFDEKYNLDKFTFRDDAGSKVRAIGNIYVVEQDGSVTILKGIYHNTSKQIAKIARRQPQQILMERKKRSANRIF